MAQTFVSVVGARPQFIKAAMVSRALRVTGQVREVMLHTGQQYDANMSRVFFEELETPEPDYDLGVGSASHGAQTGCMLEAIEQVLPKERPDWSDSTSRWRTWRRGCARSTAACPRRSTGCTNPTSGPLFAPTAAAVADLKREGIPGDRIHLAGDIVYDAALLYASKAEQQCSVLKRLGLEPKSDVPATSAEQRMPTIPTACVPSSRFWRGWRA